MINRALKDLEKARTEAKKAHEAREAANKAALEAWHKIAPGALRTLGKDAPEYIAAMEASKKEDAAKKADNLATAVLYAASTNVAYTAANALIKAFNDHPEKFNKPVHYKVFIEACKAVTGDSFYINNTWGSLYLYFRGYSGGEHEIFLCDLENNCIKYNHHTEKQRPTLTLAEIKKEAKRAQKDAEKLHKLEAELYQASEKARNGYSSYISYLLPYANQYNLHDDYKLF